MLDAGGGFQSDLTALRLGQDEYLLYVGTGAVKRDLAWLRRSLATGERVELADVTELYAVLALAGPKVADIVTTDDALGTNNLTLGGADAALFEIVGTELRLIAGAACAIWSSAL